MTSQTKEELSNLLSCEPVRMRRQRSKNAQRETTPTTFPLLTRTPDDNPFSRSQSEESADSGVSALQSRKSSQGVRIRT